MYILVSMQDPHSSPSMMTLAKLEPDDKKHIHGPIPMGFTLRDLELCDLWFPPMFFTEILLGGNFRFLSSRT